MMFRKKRKLPGAKTTKIKGHNFHVFNPLFLPVMRKKGYMRSLTEIDWGVTTNDLRALGEVLKECVNNHDLARIGAIAEYFTSVIENEAHSKVVVNMAMHFILIDDEPLEYSEEHTLKKLALCEKFDEVEDFFLTNGLRLITTSSAPLTDSEIKDYLTSKPANESEKAFLKSIGSTKYPKSKQGFTTST